MQPPKFTPTTLLISCLITVAALLGSASHDRAGVSAAPQPVAFSQTPDATRQIVERWHGVLTYDQVQSSFAKCPWACPGDYHYGDVQEWYLEVDSEGTVTGHVRTQVTAFSYSQTSTNISCGPVAETPFVYLDCTYSGQLSQPQSEIVVQGVREIESFTNRPVLKLTATDVTQECETHWKARGIHSETRATIHVEETDRCTRHIIVPQSLYITTYDDGRPPAIDMSFSTNLPSFTSRRVGQLIATTEEPFLELDRELLERSIFLDQVPIEEQFTANMNWNSPNGGWVTWKLSDGEPERIGPTEDEALPKSLNNGIQGPGQKQLTVQAQSTLKRTSPPEVTQITVAPFPAWVASPSEVIASKVSGAASYKSTRKFPEPPFTGDVNVPALVPFLGGKQLGLKQTQGSLSWDVLSTSEGQGAIGGQTGFVAMGKEVIGSLSGRARIILNEMGLRIPEGGLDFSIGGTIASDPEPLLSVVPTLRPALAAIEAISPQAAAFITERANAKLEVQPKLDFGFTFFTENDEIKFKEAQAKPSFGFKTIAEISLIKDVLQASASIGGAIAATFQVPAPYFKEVALQGLVQAQIVFMNLAWEGEKAWSLTIGAASAALGEASDFVGANVGSWQPIARDYLNRPNYARWHGATSDVQAAALAVDVEASDELLVENINPLANPSLHLWTNSVGTVRMAQAWTYDNPDAPTNASRDIAVRRNEGSIVILPTTDDDAIDDREDLAPKAVYLTNERVLVVWQRMDTATPPDFNSDPAGYLSHWQIVAARSNAGEPVVLSPNGSLNYRHQVGQLDDGALAVWINNPANQVLGDATNPDDILFARYTNSNNDDIWSATAPALTGVAGLISYDLATQGQGAALVYARDMDGDLATVTDTELFYITWDGTVWSAPTRLTNNSVADENPELVLAEDGTPMLVWRQAGTLKFLSGDWSTPPTNLPLPHAAERPDYALIPSSDGKLALVWQQAGAEATHIAYAIYDPVHNTWSNELTVALPEGAEGSMATAIAAGLLPARPDENPRNAHDGGLLVTYLLAHVEVVTRTVDNVETAPGVLQNNVTIANIAEVVQHDLRVATVPLRKNLTVTAGDLSMPAADKVQVVIHNTGDLAVENIPVALYLGPPDPESGTNDGPTSTIPLLAAGRAATLTFTVADPAESMIEAVIDPAGTLQESDRTDNRASLGTDLALSLLPVLNNSLGGDVRARVTQQGNRYVSLLAPATLTVGAPDGEVIATAQAGFPLAPTEAVTISAFVSTTMLGAGHHQLYWTLDPAGTLGDSDRSNNIIGTSITILPDLAAQDGTIIFGAASGSNAPFQMVVANQGNWPNAPTTVRVFDAIPGTDASHALLTLPVPAIEPGLSVAISGTLDLAGTPAATNGLTSLYVQIDPDEEVEESNENNNLVAAGAVLEVGEAVRFPLYMPAIMHP